MTAFIEQNLIALLALFGTFVSGLAVIAAAFFNIFKANLALKEQSTNDRLDRHRKELDALHDSNKEMREKFVTKEDLECAVERIIKCTEDSEKRFEKAIDKKADKSSCQAVHDLRLGKN